MMKYEDMPYDVQEAVETHVLAGNWAEQCLDALLTLTKDKEAAVRALAEEYGRYVHDRMQAEATLKANRLTDEDIFSLTMQYHRRWAAS